MEKKEILSALNLEAVNPGGYAKGWLTGTKGPELASLDPATGEVIAKVRQADAAAYERVAATAQQAFTTWRMVPAPKRGEMVRELGNELRANKEALGRLVSLEMGKILSEGLGEVQEMIDMCDFAVGLSRQLYGLTIAVRAAAAPDVRAVASARHRRHHHRVQLPRRGLGVERRPRGRLRRHHDLEAVLRDAADRDRRPAHLQPGHGEVRVRRHLQPGDRQRPRGRPAPHGRQAGAADLRSPARARRGGRSRNRSPRVSAIRSSSSAATTPSS